MASPPPPAAPGRCARGPCRIPDSVSSGYWSPVHDSASGSSAPSTSLTIGPWWVTVTSSASGRRSALHLDLLAHDLRLAPATLELVHPRVVGVQPLHEQVLGVGHHVREARTRRARSGRTRGTGWWAGSRRARGSRRRRGRPRTRGPGSVKVRCGSHASSGLPVTERSPETTQLFEPVACMPRPSASRTRAICSARSSPLAGVRRRPASMTIGLPRGYCGSSRAARSGPASRTMPARSSSISQLVERPKPISLAAASRSTVFHGSGSRRSSWNSTGSARGRVDRGVDARHVGGRERPPSRATARAPRARRRGACRACASAGRRAARPRPANSDSRPAVARRKNSSCQSRSCAVAEAEREGDVVRRARAHVRHAEAVAQDVDGRLQPAQAAAGRTVCGSGRLKSWYQSAGAPSAAPSVPPVAIRASGVPSIAADSFRSQATHQPTLKLPFISSECGSHT